MILSLQDDLRNLIHNHVARRGGLPGMRALSLTCRAERKGMMALKRRRAIAMLTNLFARLPVRGPLLRANTYETGRADRPWFYTHVVLAARVDLRTLNLTVTKHKLGSNNPDFNKDHKWTIVPLMRDDLPDGILFKVGDDGGWVRADWGVRWFVDETFESINMDLVYQRHETLQGFMAEYYGSVY